MTIKHYLHDDCLSGTTDILEIIDGDEKIIRTKQTWFHPQGGGQRADTGMIGSARVMKVRHAENGGVDHIVDDVQGVAVNQNAPFEIDAKGRAINAAYHTVGHLIAAIGDDICPSIKGVQGHHWPGEARVDFDGEAPDIDQLRGDIEAGLQKAFADNITVTMCGDPFENRSIKIGDHPDVPCGGTHVKDMSSIQSIEIGKIKCKKGQTRIRYEVTLKS